MILQVLNGNYYFFIIYVIFLTHLGTMASKELQFHKLNPWDAIRETGIKVHLDLVELSWITEAKNICCCSADINQETIR